MAAPSEAGPASALRLEVLGPLQAWRGDQRVDLGPVQQRVVLAVLALHANRPLGREQLIDAVWGEAAPAYAVNLVQKYVSGLRRALDPVRSARAPSTVLTWTDSGYLLSLPAGSLDLDVFDREIGRARTARLAGELPTAAQALHTALQLWRGAAFDGLTGPLLDAERDRLAERRISVVIERIEVDLALRREQDLIPELQRLAADHPLRERLRGLLMVALYRSGRQAEALAVFREAHRFLAEELGVEPTAELRDLHQRILANDPGLAGPASAGHLGDTVADERHRLPVPAQLPFVTPDFTGRAEQLGRLDSLLAAADEGGSRGMVIAAVAGTAGVGKTSLAVHWAHRISHRFPDGQLYVDLRGFDPHRAAMPPDEALRGFLDAFGMPAQRVPHGVEQQAALYRSLLAGRRVLVVLDNARDTDQVTPLLPGSPACMVVVTSRNRLSGLLAAGAVAVPVDLLSAAESRELLIRRIGQSRVDAEPRAVDDIITASARLPLALAVVAARAAAHPQFDLAGLAGELGQARGGLDAFVGENATTDARAVLSWSYQTLSDPAARLFRLLGLHPGPDLTGSAAASLAGESVARTRTLLAELSGAHLIDERSPGRFACHDLLRAYAREQAHAPGREAERRAAALRILDHYLHTARAADRMLYPYRDQLAVAEPAAGVAVVRPVDTEQALALFTAEHTNLIAAIDQAAADGADAYVYGLAWTMTAFLNYQGHWHDWAATMTAALDAARRLGDRQGQAQAHRLLNLAFIQLWRLDEAAAHARQALRLFAELGDQSGRARIHLNLGRVLERQGSVQAALDQARLALELFRAAGDWAGEADALTWVGWYNGQLGYHQQALEYCGQSLALHQGSGDWPGLADTWAGLGHAHHHLGDHREAIRCFEQALARWEELGDRYEVATALVRLGEAHRGQGDRVATVRVWRRAAAIFDELAHPDATALRARLDAVAAEQMEIEAPH